MLECFDASGAGGAEFRVNTQGFENQVSPDVIARSDGGFVIGWTDTAPPQQVYLQAYAAVDRRKALMRSSVVIQILRLPRVRKLSLLS